MSFWTLYFTRKLEEEFVFSIYNGSHHIIWWEPEFRGSHCTLQILCLSIVNAQIICLDHAPVSWLSLTHYTCASRLVCNRSEMVWTLRLTAKALCGLLIRPWSRKSSTSIWIPIIIIFSLISLLWDHLYFLLPLPTLCTSVWFHFLIFALSALYIWQSFSSQNDVRRLLSVAGLPNLIQKRIKNRKKKLK